MITIQHWLAEYGQSHQNYTNKAIHWVWVPAIFFCIVGLLFCIKLPINILGFKLNVAVLILVFVLYFYARLSLSLSIGMFLFSVLCITLAYLVEQYLNLPLWAFSIIIFALAWVGQFYGHKIEGKKPSFLKDIQFLMIGPAWLLHFLYKKIGIKL